jgi:hypothetical protein
MMFNAFVGLVIVSIALGHRYDSVTGWLVLGVGVIVLSLLNELLNYLHDRNVYREDAE